MKFNRLLAISLLLLCSSGIHAQQIYNNQVHIQGLKCEQKGDQLHVNMTVNAMAVDIPSRQALILTPVVKSGEQSVELPPMVVSGNNRYKSDKRIKKFRGETPYDNAYVVVKKGSKESSLIDYSYTIPFEPWMRTATLDMGERIYGCASCEKWQGMENLAAVQPELIEPAKPEGKPLLAYISPKAEAVKNKQVVGKAYLDFPAGKAVILTDYRNNFKELTIIRDAINGVKNNSSAVINGISLKGYSSPEGSQSINNLLSGQRATALRHYLQKEYHFKDAMFKVSTEGEDWNGLRQMIAESDRADKQEILKIIDEKSDYDVKERKLKALKKGVVFKELLNDYFPKLRRVEYTLDYTIRAFSVEEGKTFIKTHPADMSLNEMFLVANTYPKGSDEFNYVFDVAVRMYPKDIVANINAAAAVLERGDTKTAHRYLDNYQNNKESWNNQGVMYLLEGNYEKAQDFLTRAEQQGAAEANSNLELLREWQEYKVKKDAYDTAKAGR